MRQAQATSAVSLTFVRLGETRVAVPTLRVARVEELSAAADTQDDEAHVIDLGLYLGRAAHAKSELSVLLAMTGGRASLLATLPLTVVEVRTDAVHDLPDYLAPWARHRGISGVVSTNEALGFLLDVDRVVDRFLESERTTGKSA